ncbi:MAG: hypothetical protein LBI72_00635 [Flavobacteriaceae bacterium]|jgi:hypothetical protein|nr:hypothetical protein [Flavobacteriaceae bacterium]
MNRDKPFYLSLIGNNSHKVKITPGQGRFTIGVKDLSSGKCDAFVGIDDKINWNVFNDFSVPAGGNWPRVLDYTGDDTSFIQWTTNRVLESMEWKPVNCKLADFSKAKIGTLCITVEKPLTIILGVGVSEVIIYGDVNLVELAECEYLSKITFRIKTAQKKQDNYVLKEFPQLNHITDLSLFTSVVGQAVDCQSLMQFSHLTTLALSGNIINTEALVEYRALECLELRYVSNLDNFPSLYSWPNLNYFIAWNIEANGGKKLKKELDTLQKDKIFQYASISNLKKSDWFISEYGIPFAIWKGQNGKIAVKAYKEALKGLKKIIKEEEAKTILVTMIRVINTLPNIETEEREDTYLACMQLSKMANIPLEESKVEVWFDECRIF